MVLHPKHNSHQIEQNPTCIGPYMKEGCFCSSSPRTFYHLSWIWSCLSVNTSYPFFQMCDEPTTIRQENVCCLCNGCTVSVCSEAGDPNRSPQLSRHPWPIWRRALGRDAAGLVASVSSIHWLIIHFIYRIYSNSVRCRIDGKKAPIHSRECVIQMSNTVHKIRQGIGQSLTCMYRKSAQIFLSCPHT